jgi:hypothetical protein
MYYEQSICDFLLQRSMLIYTYFSLNGSFISATTKNPPSYVFFFFCDGGEIHTRHVGRWELNNKCATIFFWSLGKASAVIPGFSLFEMHD